MKIVEQVKELIKAQDMVRQVYVRHTGTEQDKLKQLDKDMTETINLLGRNRENN